MDYAIERLQTEWMKEKWMVPEGLAAARLTLFVVAVYNVQKMRD